MEVNSWLHSLPTLLPDYELLVGTMSNAGWFRNAVWNLGEDSKIGNVRTA